MIEELRPADQVELFVELDAKQRDELLPQMDVELAASEPLEERYLSASLFTPARKRGVWPLLLFVAETLTGSVLRHFEHELAAIVALVFFVPLLIGTGGNAGSQAATTVIREMALGEVRFRDISKVLSKELVLAMLLGLFIYLSVAKVILEIQMGGRKAVLMTQV